MLRSICSLKSCKTTLMGAVDLLMGAGLLLMLAEQTSAGNISLQMLEHAFLIAEVELLILERATSKGVAAYFL
ncbi:hypothetical protein [Sphingobacterium griseoflavum]|uniref:hypothetical protein n=1 Tax=Sphingobacterium griseoflavum TaxID=1474952 RepID=UPI001677CF10|nr:hypothetical protein [Sphingobacterium griseoflavum]